MVGPSSLLESRSSILEELLLPAVEHRRLEPQLVTQIRDRPLLPPNASSERRWQLKKRKSSKQPCEKAKDGSSDRRVLPRSLGSRGPRWNRIRSLKINKN